MKKAFASLLMFALIMTLMTISTAMAQTSKKVPVTVTRTGPMINPTNAESWITEGTTIHARGSIWTFINYKIKDTETNGQIIDLVGGTQVSRHQGNWNEKNAVGNVRFDTTITFPDGTFEGNIISTSHEWVFINNIPQPTSPAILHAVFHGTGSYQGWQFSYYIENGIWLEAYLLVP